MKVVFMGTSPFAVLVLEEMLKSNDFTIQTVVTKPACRAGRGQKIVPSPVCVKAQERGIPVMEPPRVNDPNSLEAFRVLLPDIVVVAAYGQILKRAILSLPHLGCVNVHASLLPRYRGADPIRWTLLNGDKESGVSLMLMDEGIDTGPLLAQRRVQIEEGDTYSSLLHKLGILGGKMVCEVLPLWAKGAITPFSQEGEVSYAPMITKEMAKISWEKEARIIVNQIRAFSLSPGAYTFFQERRVKILEGFLAGQEGNSLSPGTILDIEKKKGIVVQAGRGTVGIRTVQVEGRKPMSFWDFYCGYRLKVGDQFQ
ncbi:MAG: methionyl-tRNA formyltransferase [Atribacterota bacterium]